MAMRLTGKHAEFWWAGVKVADAYDVTITFEQDTVESSAFGDDWKEYARLRGGHRGSAKRYATYGDMNEFSAGLYAQVGGTDYTSSTTRPIRIIVYQETGAVNKLYEADVYLTESDLSVPGSGLIEGTISWVGTGAPVYVAG